MLNVSGGLNWIIRDALRELVPFLQFKNVKNTHRGVLVLVSLQLY